MKNEEEYAIEVQDVYKTFDVYLDKANSIKEKLLFWKRNRKEIREVLKGINLNIKKGEAIFIDDNEGLLEIALNKGFEVRLMDRERKIEKSKFKIIHDLKQI